MKNIIIDPGHGGNDPGANGFGVKEKDWNLKMSIYQFERLKEMGAKVGITRTKDASFNSVERTSLIKNQYDLCISNHFNAFNGKARGIETIYSIFSSDKFAKDIANSLVKVTGLPLRRVFSRKSGNNDYYFMHRLTGNTQTVIVEYGFIDNPDDHAHYGNEKNFVAAGEAVVKVICDYVGVKYVAPGKKKVEAKPKGKLFKVQAGAFSEKSGAERLAKQLQKDGYATYIVEE